MQETLSHGYRRRMDFDAIVIGAGVIGTSVAFELGCDGMRVLSVDAGPGPGSGSTSASSAIVRFNYSTRTGVAAAWESKHLWEDWEGHLGGSDPTGMARFVRCGGLVLDSPSQDRVTVAALFDELGVPYEHWTPAELRSRLPQLDPGCHFPPKSLQDEAFWQEPVGDVGACYMPDAGFVDDPALAAHNLMTAAERVGAQFRFRSSVAAIDRTSDRVSGVTLADGTRVTAPIVVNVAGPRSSAVNELAGVLDDFAIRTRPMRQEVHHVAAPAGWGDPGPFVADLDLGTYFRGSPGGGLLIGGTEPACDPLQWLDDADVYDANPTQAIYKAQIYRVARRLPGLAVPDSPRGIAGVYDVSDDWIPIYDKTALPGYYVAIGTSGNQFKNAPVVGRFMAEIIGASEAGHDHDVEPVTVKLARTGHVIDLGHYSRTRPINTSSSFGVMA
jgi:sarcosine oxidase subunit beta